MDEHFNNVVRILKEHPLAFDFAEVGSIFRELAESPNQDLLLDMITTTRSAEDRSLFCTYLLDLRRVMKRNEPDDTEFDQFIENFLIKFNTKEPILKLISFPYPENYQETISKKLEGKFHAIINSDPGDIQSLLLDILGKNTECFTIRSLHAITFDLLGSLLENDVDKTRLLGEIRSVILMARGLLVEDDYYRQSLIILNNDMQNLSQESIYKIVDCFIASNKTIDIAEMITITRPLIDRVAILSRLYNLGEEYKKNLLSTSELGTCIILLLKDDEMLRGVIDNYRVKNK